MKTVVHNERARDKTLHVETAGCIVNITVGLSNDEGKVTAVEIITDQYSGEEWHLADGGKYTNVRVVEGKAEEPRFEISDNGGEGSRREVYLKYAGRRWTVYFGGEGLSWLSYVKSGNLNLVLERYKSASVNDQNSIRFLWAKRAETAAQAAQERIKEIYRLVLTRGDE